jgi:hypothetical protein
MIYKITNVGEADAIQSMLRDKKDELRLLKEVCFDDGLFVKGWTSVFYIEHVLRLYIKFLSYRKSEKELKRAIFSMECSLKLFYRPESLTMWEKAYMKAKNVSVEDVIVVLLGCINLKYNIKCPFHEDRMPSFGVKGGRYKCFGCGSTGTAIDFVMNYMDVDFKKAIYYLNDNF